jgi:hypothetical protein
VVRARDLWHVEVEEVEASRKHVGGALSHRLRGGPLRPSALKPPSDSDLLSCAHDEGPKVRPMPMFVAHNAQCPCSRSRGHWHKIDHFNVNAGPKQKQPSKVQRLLAYRHDPVCKYDAHKANRPSGIQPSGFMGKWRILGDMQNQTCYHTRGKVRGRFRPQGFAVIYNLQPRSMRRCGAIQATGLRSWF